jgi:hypothetical protein
MRNRANTFTPLTSLAALAACLCLLTRQAVAQTPHINIPAFLDLKSAATDSVDITFGPVLLGLAGWLMDDHDPQTATLKKTVQGLKSVQIRSYRFKDTFVYPQADLDALRTQLSQPGWSQLVKVRNREQKEDVDVYMALENRTIKGVTIIASGLREFTIINVIGSVQLDEVEGLRTMLTNPSGPFAQVSQRAP